MVMNYFLDHIWLIPLLPALGAAFQFFFGRKVSNRMVSLVSVGLPGVSLAWALGCFLPCSVSLTELFLRSFIPGCLPGRFTSRTERSGI